MEKGRFQFRQLVFEGVHLTVDFGDYGRPFWRPVTKIWCKITTSDCHQVTVAPKKCKKSEFLSDLVLFELLFGIFPERFAQGFGRKDLEVGAVFAELLDEVVRGCDAEKEDAVVGATHYLLLALVDRQCAEVVGRIGSDADADILDLRHAPVYAEMALEELRGLERLGETVGLVRLGEREHAVEGIDARVGLLGMVVGLADQVPALLEDLQAIRREEERMGLAGIEAPVGDAQLTLLAHGGDDGGDKAYAGGLLFEDDAFAQFARQVDGVVQGERVEQHLPNAAGGDVVLEIERIFAGGVVADNLYAQHLVDGLPVAVEGAFGIAGLVCVVAGRARPAAVEFVAGERSGGVDGVYQPEEALEEFVLCGHEGGRAKVSFGLTF